MLARPMTYKEIKHALELSENNVHSLKCDLAKHREKYRGEKIKKDGWRPWGC